jgi:hypothetical protein
VDGSCEHGNEPSGSMNCWELVASREGLIPMELVISPDNTESDNLMIVNNLRA